MQRAHDIARRHLAANAKRQKSTYNIKLQVNNFKAGDMVWLLHKSRKVGVNQKLEKLYDGPFLVKRKITDVNFLLQLDRKGLERVVHHDKIKPFEARDVTMWIKKSREELTR